MEPDASYARLRHLQSISDAALAHLRFDELVEELLARVIASLHVDTAAVLLVDDERDELVARAAKGIEEEVEAEVRVPIGRGFAGRVAATRQPVAISEIDGADIVNPILREKGLRSLLGAPLVVEGRVTGVLHVGTLAPREFTADDAELLQLAADRIAVAIDHARLYEAERAARAAAEANADRLRRIESIAEVALHHITLDEEIIERLLTRVRDVLDTDTVGLWVLDDVKQRLVTRAAKGLDIEVERDVEVPVGRGFAGRVAEARAPVVVEDARSTEIVSPLLRERVRSLAGVPLVVEDRLLGVLHVGSLAQRSFSEDDVALLRLAGERLAVALDHSRLYEREHLVAETLQRALLPERLPEVTGAALAARYLPGEGEAVGGDWYDAIPLRDGRVTLAMGDVVSRGLRAASVMAQLRNALRAYAAEGYEPRPVIERLDGMTRALDGRELATLFYAVLDPATGELVYGNAGHPPALVLAQDGRVRLLDDGRGPPLGALADPVFGSATATLGHGETLVLYTDGLVERRDVWIDEGLARLVDRAGAVAGRAPEELLGDLVQEFVGSGAAEDDVALLALRLEPAGSRALVLDLPADPNVLASMRQSLRTWLAATQASADDVYDILVASTEAAANAVEHAYGPGDASFRVEAHMSHGGRIEVVVRDHGQWRPPRGHNRGRGTMLMQQLMDEFEVATGETGTEVRMNKRLAGRLAA